MRTHRTRRWRLAAVTASGALVVGSLAMAGGAAADESGEWQIGIDDGSGDVITASTGDVFTGEGTLDLKGEYNGVETHVVCDIDPDGLTWQVPSTPPSDSSGGTLSLDVEVPQDLTADGYASCEDTLTESAVEVTTSGVDWTLHVDVPEDDAPPADNPFIGTSDGELDIPADAITAQLTGLPGTDADGHCTLVGPDAPPSTYTFGGSYDGSDGKVSIDSNQTFDLDNSECPNGDTAALINSGGSDYPGTHVTLSVESPSKYQGDHPDLVFQ